MNPRSNATQNRSNQRGREPGEDDRRKPVISFGPYGTGGGTIDVAVWENTATGDNGEYSVFSVTIRRSYKEGDQWKQSGGLRKQDLPVAIYALQRAYQWLMEKGQE